MILIKNAAVYSPDFSGKRDILIGGGKIPEISGNITIPSGVEVEEFDAEGLIAVPGLIDNHVHIAGAGGEGGPATRTPELSLSRMFEGGVTTVVG